MQENIISIEDLVRNLNSVNLDEEVLVFETIGREMPDVFPLRVDAMLIILCRAGHARMGIDMRTYDLEKDTLIVLQPKNYISLMECDAGFAANIVGCSRRIVEEVLPRLSDVLPLLMHHRTSPAVQLSEEQAASINGFHTFLRQKLAGPKTPFLKKKVVSILQGALYEMMDIQIANSEDVRKKRTRKEEIMAQFLLCVSENFREQRQVSYYADKLCITPKHLSTVVRDVSGRTAGHWIESYVVMEAKVLLRTTDLPIQEIAMKLNFYNQSFFGKYFKHVTGLSPSQYRKEERPSACLD